MRFLIIAFPKFSPPLDQLPALVEAEKGWHERHRDRLEVHGWFVGGGGFVIANVEDDVTLNQVVMEHPFTPFSDVQVRAFVDHETGSRQLQQFVQEVIRASGS